MKTENAPMNKWVYYKNDKRLGIRYYMHRVSVVDAEIALYMINCEYGYGTSDCTRDEYLYTSKDMAQHALNYMSDWEGIEG